MPTKKKVDKWEYSILGYYCEGENVVKIWCKTCRDFYTLENINVGACSSKSFIKDKVDKYVQGTTVIKKSNFDDHVPKSVAHATAVQRLNEEANDITKPQRSIIATATSMNSQLHDNLL